ncbi:MAG: septum formation initiator family protein [Candidatus Krumholzibacteria bacterium]|nr:septum formation initiator family protein [Candidatus Krumholzibacteria bacterium]
MSNNRPAAKDGFVRGNQQQANALARRSLFVVLGLGLVALVALVQFGENGIFAFFNLRGHEGQLQREVVQLETDNQQMDRQLEALTTDPEALEKLARERHNMRREDEEVLLVLPPTGNH